ncbi:C-type lectin domain family 4 member E-like isoform X2 [Anabas testudineus]|uniref:C-type lectin domain family 4 member E-like isoform X2 n=1 Tax=Anabas testudineus TaxID=64144 RepID=UPI000E4550C9|nr:C-type lectin domain family 4 member E-like isoform X2 [Anabas testudineus]
MSTPGSPPATEGMYSKLIDDEGAFDEFRPNAHPGSPVRLPVRPSGPGLYRLATVCLATLCGVLLISIIAVAAHYTNKPRSGGEATSALQKQTQDANVTVLSATINKLQQEKSQLQKEKAELQKEKAELQAKLAATKAPAQAPVTCPMNWKLFGSSCYFISTVSRSWQEGQDFCQTHGAHLAIIHTAEEQTFLWNLLPRGHWNAYWFGITDEHTEDKWKWVDGTPLVGGFWEVGEPNNHINEDCGYIVKTRVLERVAIRSWYDAPCSMYWPFICEKEMNTSTITPTAH